MDNPFIFHTTSKEELNKIINSCIEDAISQHLSQTPQQNSFLTRKEVANMFKISLSTLRNWEKRGIIKSEKVPGARGSWFRSQNVDALLRQNPRYKHTNNIR